MVSRFIQVRGLDKSELLYLRPKFIEGITINNWAGADVIYNGQSIPINLEDAKVLPQLIDTWYEAQEEKNPPLATSPSVEREINKPLRDICDEENEYEAAVRAFQKRGKSFSNSKY